MRRTIIGLAAAASAALAMATVAAQPATAASNTRLTVTVRPATGPAKVAWLTCRPAGGTHRRAAAACDLLIRAGGDPGRIPPVDGVCTMEYAPVTVKVTGRWASRPVRYRERFGNRCTAGLQLGPVADI